MFCSNCGAELDEDDKFCSNCGVRVKKPIKSKKKSKKLMKEWEEEMIHKAKKIEMKSLEKEYEDKIELPVKEHLTNGERVICKHGNYYATNKRVFFVKRGTFGKLELKDLAYRHISSLQLKTEWNEVLFTFGFLVMLGSIIYLFMSQSSQLIIGIMFGIFLMIIGFLHRWSFYELRAPGLEKPWRINAPDKLSAKNFVKTIRDYLK
ncbi:MAG: zinc-ribbon domain-containing protein [Candidatus Helarchaeota archaeon]